MQDAAAALPTVITSAAIARDFGARAAIALSLAASRLLIALRLMRPGRAYLLFIMPGAPTFDTTAALSLLHSLEYRRHLPRTSAAEAHRMECSLML